MDNEEANVATSKIGSIFAVRFTQWLPGAFLLGCIIMLFTAVYTVFESYPVPLLKYSSIGNQQPIIHNFSNPRSDVYEMIGDIRLNGSSATILMVSNSENNMTPVTVKPYARKADNCAMQNVREWKITAEANVASPRCSQTITTPAVVFSTAGYSGNHFHDFSDTLLPLYLTSRQFNRSVLFLVTNAQDWWISKHYTILDSLSSYNILDIDSQNEVLCFSRVIIGLKADKDLRADHPSPPHYSMLDFAQFLRNVYSLGRESVKDFHGFRLPRMLIISRQHSRRINNEGDVVDMARGVGFDVIAEEMGHNIDSVAHLVNSVDVMVGVHGAGLTNQIFLPKDAVVIQIMPIGLDVLPHFYDFPPKDLKLRYIGYSVSLNESSLFGKYPMDSEVFTNPRAIQEYEEFKSIYLDNQDLNIDVSKFRETILKAKELLEP
uniref:GT61_7 n=1 Tax=Plantago ovata TaxID=185002 RepID=S5SD05_PLAOV|nr:GT61_7 [Plantago ovata]